MVTPLEFLTRLAEGARLATPGPLGRLPAPARALLPLLPVVGPAIYERERRKQLIALGLAEPPKTPVKTR